MKRDPLGSTQDVQSWISLRFSTYNFSSEGSIIQKQTNDTLANPKRNFLMFTFETKVTGVYNGSSPQ